MTLIHTFDFLYITFLVSQKSGIFSLLGVNSLCRSRSRVTRIHIPCNLWWEGSFFKCTLDQNVVLANLYPTIDAGKWMFHYIRIPADRKPPFACITMDPSQMPPVVMDSGSGYVGRWALILAHSSSRRDIVAYEATDVAFGRMQDMAVWHWLVTSSLHGLYSMT